MTKKQITISIISIVVIMITFIIYAMYIKEVSIAALGAKYVINNDFLAPIDFININNNANGWILTDLCVFSLVQLVSYILYFLKKKKVLLVLGGLELIVLISAIVRIICYHSPLEVIYSMPIINIVLYLISLKETAMKRKSNNA